MRSAFCVKAHRGKKQEEKKCWIEKKDSRLYNTIVWEEEHKLHHSIASAIKKLIQWSGCSFDNREWKATLTESISFALQESLRALNSDHRWNEIPDDLTIQVIIESKTDVRSSYFLALNESISTFDIKKSNPLKVPIMFILTYVSHSHPSSRENLKATIVVNLRLKVNLARHLS